MLKNSYWLRMLLIFEVIETPSAFPMAYQISGSFDRFQHREAPPVVALA